MASAPDEGISDFLHPPRGTTQPRPEQRIESSYVGTDRFKLNEKTYQQQYSDMYFLRLATLKPVVDELATEAWERFELETGETPRRVQRVLDVRQGELCWVTGTIYMDMPLKPNILDDISKDHFIVPPPPREKYVDMGLDKTMLEDESGRLRLSGAVLEQHNLVTGVIVSVLGSESSTGDFAVIDIKIPELPPQDPRPKSRKGKKVCLVSGLNITGAEMEGLQAHILTEYLLGEAGGTSDHQNAASIAHIILLGDSLRQTTNPLEDPSQQEKEKKISKKYGYDRAKFNPAPTKTLDNLLCDLLPSIPVTILPGNGDPANISMPQQPLHAALFASAKLYDDSSFFRVTNPWAGGIDGVDILATSGQNVDDIYKYLEGEDRLAMCERMLRWRNVAPTAPDTLWSYPFQDHDPFVLDDKCPHVFAVGNQPMFASKVIEGDENQVVRIILVPTFSETGEVVLLDLDTLEVDVVRIEIGSV